LTNLAQFGDLSIPSERILQSEVPMLWQCLLSPATRAGWATLLVVNVLIWLGAALLPQPAYAAGIIVTSAADAQADDGFCTLREAILNANADNQSGSTACSAGSGADVITFNGNYTITLTADLPPLASSLTIDGIGREITISGANARRVFNIQSGGVVTLSRLKIINGALPPGGLNCPDSCGGGILVSSGAALTLNQSTLSGNLAGLGGGIFNSGTLTVNQSTLSSNSASRGGGIRNNGTLTVNNSTFSGNLANDRGGGIFNGGVLTLNHSTLNGNSASLGGGIRNEGILHLRNTIVANSPFGGECSNLGSLATNVNNLIEDGSCSSGAIGFVTGDPNLGPLQDNGGPTFTHALLSPSPAIDAAGDCTPFLDPDQDQRGVVRPLDGNGDGAAVCDIGAFEALSPPEIEVRGNNLPIAAGDTTPSLADQTDFGGVPVAGGAVMHTFTISNTGLTDLLLTGSPAVMIGGPAAAHFGLAASPATPVAPGSATTFQVTFDPAAAGLLTATLTIANNDPNENPYTFVIQGTGCFNPITVSNTGDSGPGTLRQALAEVCNGGVIDFAGSLANQTISLTSAELTIAKTVTITNPNAPNLAISGVNARRVFEIQAGGVVTLSYLSVISGVVSDDGGGIFNGGVLTLNNSALSGNSASLGGGILNKDVLTLNNSTLSGNSAGLGGGIYNVGTLTVTNSTLNGNSASFGGGIYNNGTLHLRNTLVANSLSGGDCSGDPATNVNNLIEDNTCSPALSGDPNLGPLQDNGGPTFTHALLSPSPAIDAGDAGTCLATDQRGINRPLDGDGDGLAICDIGAYEVVGVGNLYLPVILNQAAP
jgi:CSLREA domain-containing protein